MALLALENLDFSLHVREGLFESQHVGRGHRRRRPRSRRSRVRFRSPGSGCGELTLELGNFRRELDDIRVFLVELTPGLRQLFLLLGQPVRFPQLGRRERHDGPVGAIGVGGRERFDLGQLGRERLTPLGGSRLTVGVLPKLSVESIQRLKVHVHLLRQLPEVSPLERADALLLVVEPLFRIAELDLQEFRGSSRLALPRLQVLVDVEAGERVRDERDRGRIVTLIGDGKGDGGLAQAAQLRALDLQPDIAAHPTDDVLERRLLPELDVQVEAVDQRLQPRAAQHFLADRMEAGLEGAGDRGSHEGLRDLLPIDENGRGGPIEIRQEGDEAETCRRRNDEREHCQPFPTAPDRQQRVQLRSFARLSGHLRVPQGTTTMSPLLR